MKTKDFEAPLKQQRKTGHKLQGVLHIRNIVADGLKRAKEIADAYWEGQPIREILTEEEKKKLRYHKEIQPLGSE
jgi:hypothetical protein